MENQETVENQEKVEETGAEKRFTQEELNSFLKREKEKLTKTLPSKEELQAFRDWKEQSKSNEDKIAEMSVELSNAKKDSEKLSHILEVTDKGVSSKFRKFVASEVENLEGDFNTNLEKYLKDNPDFVKSKEVIKTVNTSPKFKGGENSENSTNSIMNDLIRSARK